MQSQNKSCSIDSFNLPDVIPMGARIVVRTCKIRNIPGESECKHREYYDVIGHVIDWDGVTLHIMRDPAANGSRAAQEMYIDSSEIVRWKPILERRFQKPLK